MNTENLSTLKIHKLTQAQYERELANNKIDSSALYLTPEEDIDLSPYALVADVEGLQSKIGDKPVAEQISDAIKSKSDLDHQHSEYVNQNAFSNVKVGSTTIDADSATDTLSLVAGSNVTLTPDATNNKVTIAATDTVYTHPNSGVTAGSYRSVTVNAQGHVIGGSNPTTLSGYGITDAATNSSIQTLSSLVGDTPVSTQISNAIANKADSGHTHPTATTSAAGLMSASDKSKLNGIAAGANAYTHPTNSGNKHIPSGGSSGQILRWASDGTAVWGADNNTTYTLGSFGITATAAELNYTDGVTSNIQTQLNGKAASSHTHDDRYFTESEINTKLAGKSDTSHTHTAAAVGAAASGHTHDERYYTESEINSLLSVKAASNHDHNSSYHTKSEVNNLLSGKAASSHTHDDRYYTESEINTKLAGKSDTSHSHTAAEVGAAASGHTHDDRYYTESEINTKLEGKSDTSHSHTGVYAPADHQHDSGVGITRVAVKTSDSNGWFNINSSSPKFFVVTIKYKAPNGNVSYTSATMDWHSCPAGEEITFDYMNAGTLAVKRNASNGYVSFKIKSYLDGTHTIVRVDGYY